MYDVVIIGAGVTGSACARELSRYHLNICVVEANEDVCTETSKANSGIVHSGIDATPGSLMAEMNIIGNSLMEPLSKELDFSFQRNGSLILCFSIEDIPKLEELYRQGLKNQVPELKMLTQTELQEMEPNVSKEAVAAIYAPTGGIVCPFGLNIALAENAADNGVEFKFNTKVLFIEKQTNGYSLKTTQGTIDAKCVVNAAGVYADTFHNMVSTSPIHITPRRGEYCLLDKAAGTLVSKTIFQLPGAYGKGVLVTPTVHGNILIGPTAYDHEEKDSVLTTTEGLSYITESAKRSVPSVPLRQVITSFSGNRAHEDNHEFIIEEVKDAPFFIDVAGIESPGLTSAPAIGLRVCEIVTNLLHPGKNNSFSAKRTGILDPKTLSVEEYNALIHKEPAYGTIICRCEMITEGEILDAIHRTLGAKSLDGIKRRTRTGMGRCQAGFCSPKTIEILARELHVSQLEITKSGGSSNLITGRTKNSLQEVES